MSEAYPNALQDLIQALAHLPGIGKRTAERLATTLMEWDEAALHDLGDQIRHLRDRVMTCRECGNLADGERCRICADPERDAGVICVVELARQIPGIERCGRFRGRYHVLGGRLSPLDGIDAEDLNLEALYARLAREPVREVIVSTSPDVEGEATAAYLAEELAQRSQVTVSRIAMGIPVGSDLSFADAATWALALESRRPLSPPSRH